MITQKSRFDVFHREHLYVQILCEVIPLG